MRRADFLELSNLTGSELDARVRRGQLPFYSVDRSEGSWSNYAPFDAFLVALSTSVAANGLGLAGAALNVRNGSDRLKADWLQIAGGKADYFFGVARVDASDGLGQIEVKLFGTVDVVLEPLIKLKGRRIDNVVLSNASRAWREVKERAAAEHIDINDVFGDE